MKNVERLNITDIQNKIVTYTKGREKELVEKGGLEIKNDNLLMNIASHDPDKINYFERNTKTGERTSIRGDKNNGFKKEMSNNEDKLVIIKEFYGDGKIRSIEQVYSEGEHGLGKNRVEFPTGKKFKYDRDGNLVETIDYDKIFKFSYSDVIKLFAKKGNILGEIKGYSHPDGTARWDIFYHNVKSEICVMRIDAKTGHIIYDSHNITFIE